MSRWLFITHDKVMRSATDLKVTDSLTQFELAAEARSGDDVILFRPEPGGLVGFGKVSVRWPALQSRAPAAAEMVSATARHAADDVGSSHDLAVSFDHLFLGNPIPVTELKGPAGREVMAKALSAGRSHRAGIRLELTDEQWRSITSSAQRDRSPVWPSAWTIEPGTVTNRQEMHSVYGGNTRVAVGASGRTPNVFVFLKRHPRLNDLRPKLVDGLLHVPGHTQYLSTFSAENAAVLTHLRRGKALRVFDMSGPDCRYIGEFVIDLQRPFERWVDTGERYTLPSAKLLAGGRDLVLKVQAPIFRLKQISGIELPSGYTPYYPFPHVRLSLQPTSVELGTAVGPDPAADRGEQTRATIQRLVTALKANPGMVEAIGRIDETRALTALVQNARRTDELARLKRVAEDPGSRERELQQLLEQMPWIFGGDFLSVATRRSLTVLDQLDIPLIRADGSLHGVELKLPRIKELVYRHRNHLVVGPDVSEAAGQAMNYLRSLDEQYHVIRGELGIDCRRSSMTVVIGDSHLAPQGITSKDVLETLRTLNSHLVRVEVVTYDQLIDRAARVISIADPARATLPADS